MTKLSNNVFLRVCSLALLVSVGCAAQSSAPEVDRRMERQIRSYFNVPTQVSIAIGPHRPSDFANYDAVTVTFSVADKKQEQEFLISKDSKSLIRMTKIDMSKDPYLEVMSKMDLAGRPVRGNKDAKVTIVNYDDFQCPFCARMHETLTNDILKTYGDKVKVVYKDYPLTEIHPWAKRAAIDANCLAAQDPSAYWTFADSLHANAGRISATKEVVGQQAAVDSLVMEEGRKFHVDTTKLEACVKAQNDSGIKSSMAEADLLGVQSTPTMFINGQKLEGAVPASDLKTVIDRALAGAGQTPPAPAAPAQAKPGVTSQKPENGGQ